ncbi:YicC/YloC family endoribonuclease [Geotalea sp. SG265]|uniref:YicC/YloC family endoribonuclease n=1 Tax=Geotalea sp. SG265 TaxID=2922867 RepID=UPI001FAEBA0D|nr:YicC/YloC family endoribonuclease [Geotalea sp. SG265]
MIKSMTGYGKAETDSATGKLTVEIRSVNHRYGEIFVKLPRLYMPFENDVKKSVGQALKRGKIEVFIQREEAAAGGALPVPNLELAKAYFQAFSSIKGALGLDEEVSLSLVAAQRDVIGAAEAAAAPESAPAELMAAVEAAVGALDAMRSREGEALLEDLQKRRALLSVLIARIAGRAPQVVADYAVRLKERVAQLAADTSVTEDRLAQEIAIMADRCDITEELVRFNSHLQQFDETIAFNEPVGRKLDFLLQEINREVNTIGSKANDGEIAACVVELKAELEKIREQVQNIE